MPIAQANNVQFGNVHFIDSSDLENDYRTIYLPDLWQFKAGDDISWSQLEIDDWDWESVSTLLGPNQLPLIEWNGIGWFRLLIEVDESLVGVPLALDVNTQSGASEIYHNGKLIYAFGVVSSDSLEEVGYQERLPKSFIFTEAGLNVIAVRYSNHRANQFVGSGYNAGFRYLLVEMNHQVSGVMKNTRTSTIHQFLFSGVLFVFTIIHLLLFLFYPKLRQNLFFAMFTATFGILNYLNYEVYFSTSGLAIINIIQMQLIFVLLTMVFFLLFSYSLYYHKIPKQFYVFALAFLSLGFTFNSNSDVYLERILLVLGSIFVLEIVRILLVAAYKRHKGALVFSVGLILFMSTEIYAVGVNMEYFNAIFAGSAEFASISGIIVLLITMSVSLSRSFAETNVRLEDKLREVQALSEQTIEQERISKQKELERLLLQADNERKTNELEEARQLQLSMLPVELPSLNSIDLSARIKTATEVGGDYYDFAMGNDGTITMVIGDATGHGVKAGIVVAAVKSYFKSFVNNYDLVPLLRLMSHGLKNMNLRMIYMALTLARFDGKTINIVGAGMPPCLFYESKTGKVKTLLSKGMPLGSMPDYPYELINQPVNRGDMMIMMSDGIMEAFNDNREQLGLDAIVQTLVESGHESPDSVLDKLENLVSTWIKGQELEDDYTLLAMKFHPEN